jgi:hypothetical protein
LTLVFNIVDCILISPVDGFWDRSFRKLNDISLNISNMSSKKSLVLTFSPGREFVVSNRESVFGVRIDLCELSIFLLEELEAEVEFFLGTIRKTELIHVIDESRLESVVVHFGAEVVDSEEAGRLADELHFSLLL